MDNLEKIAIILLLLQQKYTKLVNSKRTFIVSNSQSPEQ